MSYSNLSLEDIMLDLQRFVHSLCHLVRVSPATANSDAQSVHSEYPAGGKRHG